MSGVCHNKGWLEYLRLHNRIKLNKINDIFLPKAKAFNILPNIQKCSIHSPTKFQISTKVSNFQTRNTFHPWTAEWFYFSSALWHICSLQTFNSKTRWCVMLLTSQRQPRELYLSPTANKAICWYVAIGAIYWMGSFLVLWLDRLGPVSI